MTAGPRPPDAIVNCQEVGGVEWGGVVWCGGGSGREKKMGAVACKEFLSRGRVLDHCGGSFIFNLFAFFYYFF